MVLQLIPFDPFNRLVEWLRQLFRGVVRHPN